MMVWMKKWLPCLVAQVTICRKLEWQSSLKPCWAWVNLRYVVYKCVYFILILINKITLHGDNIYYWHWRKWVSKLVILLPGSLSATGTSNRYFSRFPLQGFLSAPACVTGRRKITSNAVLRELLILCTRFGPKRRESILVITNYLHFMVGLRMRNTNTVRLFMPVPSQSLWN